MRSGSSKLFIRIVTRAQPAKDSTEDLEDPNSFDFYFIGSSIRVPTLCECKTALAWDLGSVLGLVG